MRILEVTQGSPEWSAARAAHRCASDAPAMMGESDYKSRSDLIKQTALGLVEEFDGATQARFDRGHANEAAARPIIEARIGDDLFPITATDDDGYLLASLDGITMDEKITWECKTPNAKLRAAVQSGDLPPSHYWQMEHQLCVTGAEKVLFTISDGTEDGTVSTWYWPLIERRKALLAGWAQFDKDVAAYQPTDDAPRATATAIESLPSLIVRLTGEVTESNLNEYRAFALARIESVNTELTTDQHFIDAEKMVKFFDSAEKELELVKAQALAQTKPINDLFRTIDVLKESMRAKRLMLDKLVKSRKEAVRG